MFDSELTTVLGDHSSRSECITAPLLAHWGKFGGPVHGIALEFPNQDAHRKFIQGYIVVVRSYVFWVVELRLTAPESRI